MPLLVVNEDRDLPAAREVFWEGRGCTFPFIGTADYGTFWTSQNTAQDTALTTEHAGPCQIILVHCTNGHGALGHYAAHPNPSVILNGLQRMLAALPGATVDSILFAAGLLKAPHAQLMYEMQAVAGARQMAPAARVSWPAQHGDVWGSVMYLPRSGRVALFHTFPVSVIGRSEAGNGLAQYSYHA